MIRKYFVSDIQIDAIKTEVAPLKQHCIITPDSDASYKSILDILNNIRGD
jgi:hypothetical protein